MNIVIRENIDEYMGKLRRRFSDIENLGLEEMSDFFDSRVNIYEDHMAMWKDAYSKFATVLPSNCNNVLDLGCGTGLELDEIFKVRPNINITGVDLCEAMLRKLKDKHGDKSLNIQCEDYFKYDMGKDKWDAVISFESLHHFIPEKKRILYKKIYNGLKEGSSFILGDYIACCDEEENLLRSVCEEKRKQYNVPDEKFVHFDIPLTLEHEIEILKDVGFRDVSVVDSINGATIILSVK